MNNDRPADRMRVIALGARQTMSEAARALRRFAEAINASKAIEISDELHRLLREMDDPPPPPKPCVIPPKLRARPHRGKMRKAQRGVEHSSRRGLRMHRRQAR